MEQTELVTLLEAVGELSRAQTALLDVALGELGKRKSIQGESKGLKGSARSFAGVDDLLTLLMALSRDKNGKETL